MNNWISVKDRLPEKLLQQCLIAHKEGGVMLAEYCEGTKRSEEIRYFQTHNNEYDLQGDYVEITHWQPPPEPPRGDSCEQIQMRSRKKPLLRYWPAMGKDCLVYS